MRSVGEAAAQGLESGFGLGLRMYGLRREDEDRQRRQRIEDEDRAWVMQERTRRQQQQDDELALRALEDQGKLLQDEGAGLFARYGEKVPDEIAGPYKQRVGELTKARTALLRKRWAPLQQDAADVVSRMSSGQLDPRSVPSGQLYRALAISMRRDPSDLIGTEGQPSRVSQAMADLTSGMESGNENLMLRGANVLLEPELRVGVGEPSP